MTTTTASVHCPADVACCAGKCGGEAVQARYGKQVTVEACSFLVAQGWTGPGLVLTHSQALQYLAPVTTAGPVRHDDGLVVFA